MYYEKRKNNSFGIAIILAFLVAILIILWSLTQKIDNSFLKADEQTELTGTDVATSEFNLQNLIENASYSVVGISKLNEKSTAIFAQNSEEKLGIGSGIILTADGFILSNCETTGKEGENCFVTLKSGNIYQAEVKWANENLDVSIIKIAAENLLPLNMGDSNNIKIGDEFYLLSNSTGYDMSFINLLISKAKTTFKTYKEQETVYVEDVIKTNLRLEFEDNGGAMLNKEGEVLGISSKKINSIVPINRIKVILNKLKENEDYKEPYLGIFGFDNKVTKYLNENYPLKLGIYVDKVDENSPASGQILIGDIITRIDDYELSSFQELSEYIYLKSPKDIVNLTIIRRTKELVVPIILK